MNSSKNKLNSKIIWQKYYFPNGHLVSVWIAYFLPAYFTIQFILLLFMGPTALFDTIHGSHCTISANFYFYLQ